MDVGLLVLFLTLVVSVLYQLLLNWICGFESPIHFHRWRAVKPTPEQKKRMSALQYYNSVTDDYCTRCSAVRLDLEERLLKAEAAKRDENLAIERLERGRVALRQQMLGTGVSLPGALSEPDQDGARLSLVE